jgi:alpha-mannosidase
VKEGRLEFVNGGWVAHDEACPTFEEIMVNMMIGHSFLNKTFGIVPKHAWQVDTFGHSAATPELLRRMGMESLFFSRVDT